MRRLSLLGPVLALIVLGGCGDELRVEITDYLPLGTTRLAVSLTMNPLYCVQRSGAACSQFFQTEFEPRGLKPTFRLALSPDLANFYLPNDAARISLRVEARGPDRCLVGRATQLLSPNDREVGLSLSPVSGRCTLALALVGNDGTSVSFGDGQCPSATASTSSSGTTCVAEWPQNSPVTLTAKADFTRVFDHWEGDSECAGSGKPTCALPMTGPATVRAVFR